MRLALIRSAAALSPVASASSATLAQFLSLLGLSQSGIFQSPSFGPAIIRQDFPINIGKAARKCILSAWRRLNHELIEEGFQHDELRDEPGFQQFI
jgi:hypothetical protein